MSGWIRRWLNNRSRSRRWRARAREHALQPDLQPDSGIGSIEPFGQQGVRQYFLPVFSLALLLISAASATMWVRTQSITDRFARIDGHTLTTVTSIYGRIVVARQRVEAQPLLDFISNQWNYAQMPAPFIAVDPWQDSWKKCIGIEWKHGPLQPQGSDDANEASQTDWWLRVRWQTVVVITGMLPVVRMLRFEIARVRRWRARKLAIQTQTSSPATPA